MAPHELQNKNVAELRGIEFCQRVRKVSSETRKAPILDLGPIQREAGIAVLALCLPDS
jgi:response regulator RpfG family c-di-GMP phosphodiesterase